MFIFSILVEVVGNAEGKEDHSFLRKLLVVHLLLGWEFQLGKQSKFPAVNHYKSVRRKQLTSTPRKGSYSEGQFANLQGRKDQRCCDMPLMVVRCSYFPLLRLEWPAPAAICFLVIEWVPGRPCQESRQGHYPE